MNRRILPQRRCAQTFDLRFWNQRFTVTAGFFDDGTIGEVFVDARKTGGDVEAIARDAAVVISLALQYGVAVESIRHAVTRCSNGLPASIVGAVVDSISANSFSGEPR